MSFLCLLIKLQIFSGSRVQYMKVVKTEARRDGSDSEEEDNLTFHLLFVYFFCDFYEVLDKDQSLTYDTLKLQQPFDTVPNEKLINAEVSY